jgi:mono/diheme cytochrome c family protein
MQKFLNLLIVPLVFFIFACEQKTDNIPPETVSADTSIANPQAPGDTTKTDFFELTYTERRGKRLYEHYCAICHGVQGKGDGFNAYNLNPKPKDIAENGYLNSVTNDWLKQVISLGGRGVKRSVLMPAYEGTLNEEQTADVVAYLRHLSQN